MTTEKTAEPIPASSWGLSRRAPVRRLITRAYVCMLGAQVGKMLVAVAALKQVPLTDTQVEQLTAVEFTLNLLPDEKRVERAADILRNIVLTVLREAIICEIRDLAPKFAVHDVLFGFVDSKENLFVENTRHRSVSPMW